MMNTAREIEDLAAGRRIPAPPARAQQNRDNGLNFHSMVPLNRHQRQVGVLPTTQPPECPQKQYSLHQGASGHGQDGPTHNGLRFSESSQQPTGWPRQIRLDGRREPHPDIRPTEPYLNQPSPSNRKPPQLPRPHGHHGLPRRHGAHQSASGPTLSLPCGVHTSMRVFLRDS